MSNQQLGLFDNAPGTLPNIGGRDSVMEHFEERSPDWLSFARSMAVAIAKERGRVTSDDVIERIGEPPPYVHRNVIGAMFALKGQFHRIGVVPSRRPKNHASIIGVWAIGKIEILEADLATRDVLGVTQVHQTSL